MAEPVAITEAHGGAPHAEPTALGLDASMWVAAAMAVVLLILIAKKVPAAIGRSLDARIAAIRAQLDEAAQLRREAEAIKAEYEAKNKAADSEAAALVERARNEADAILAKAQADADALVARRAQMAEAKIGAEERAALDAVRAEVTSAAARAAALILAERSSAEADAPRIDAEIARI